MALYPLSPLISKCHITIWTRRWHDAGPPPQDAWPASRQLQQARHSVGPIIVPSEYSPHQCFGVPCWYNAGPPSPDAGPASHQRWCKRPAMLPVLWPVANVLQIGPQRWFNAGPTLFVRIMNRTLAQHWVNAYNSFHLYINMLFFSLTSRINQSCQTDAVLITVNKSKRDDSRAWFWQLSTTSQV